MVYLNMSRKYNDEIAYKIHYEDLPRRKVTHYYSRSIVAGSRRSFKHYITLFNRALFLLDKAIRGKR